MYTQITQFLRIPPTHSPDVSNWENLQRLQALLIGVYQTALIVCRISLGIFRCHLGQCPCGSNAYAHWHAHPLTDSFGQVFTPTFQVLLLHAVEQQEGLIDGVNLNRWSCLTQDFHDPAGHVPIQCIVTGQCLYLHAWKKFSQLIIRCAFLHAQRLCLWATGHHTPVIVTQHHHGLAFKSWVENPLARNIAIVTIYQSEHSYRYKMVSHESHQSQHKNKAVFCQYMTTG